MNNLICMIFMWRIVMKGLDLLEKVAKEMLGKVLGEVLRGLSNQIKCLKRLMPLLIIKKKTLWTENSKLRSQK
jgi:hypothetical protein